MQKTAALMGQDFFLGDQMQDRHIEAALGGNSEASAALSVTVGAVPWPWEGPAPEPALASKSFCRSYILIVNLLLSEMSSFSDCSLQKGTSGISLVRIQIGHQFVTSMYWIGICQLFQKCFW